jgi:hypothetical protein
VKTLGSVLLGAACIAFLLAPSAQAHKLTAKRAEAALKPVVTEFTPKAAAKIAEVLPGATIAETQTACEVGKTGRKKKHKNGHVASCAVLYSVAGASTGEKTFCTLPAGVEFRSKKSKELKVTVLPELFSCFFIAPLE